MISYSTHTQRLDVLTSVRETTWNVVFSVAMQCSLVDRYLSFGGIICLHIQGRGVSQVGKMVRNAREGTTGTGDYSVPNFTASRPRSLLF